MEQKALYDYLLLLGDNPTILGQRLGELCGHGPELETDIALTNISLDLFGQVRNYFQYAAEVIGNGATEDSVAMLRHEHEYKNALLVEQPNRDFAYVICRQFLFDIFHQLLLNELMSSKNERISAIAHKSVKEVDYHVDFSSTWMKRLGDGTEESNQRLTEAMGFLWRYSMELFKPTETETLMAEMGVGPDLSELKPIYMERVNTTLQASKLVMPEKTTYQYGGKTGRHTEYMGYILAEFQYMQRAYPNMKW
ncbi:MAG: phenylacetate-CoA oxygenase subunit PaaI [Verrucomicrobia bacterium]|nr:phenylacetate-CoA oxygenase subunit PaaI [Verrucomicrobiota bacterium]